MYDSKNQQEVFTHTSEVTNIQYRPDGKELISTTFKGDVTIWDVKIG